MHVFYKSIICFTEHHSEKNRTNLYWINKVKGIDGTGGTDGMDGIDGTDGTDGIGGIDGTDGTEPAYSLAIYRLIS